MRWRHAGLLLLAGLSSPAAAQVSLGVSVTSDYRFRGYSLSNGRPAASARIGYDDPSGLFLDGSATVFLSEKDSPEWMGGIAAIGYAARLRSGQSVDVGIVRAQFSRASGLGREGGYTELFAGLTGRILSARIAYSPDYYRPGISTLYGQIEASIRPADNWRLSAHIGALTRIAGTPRFPIRATQYDWRAGVTRVIGKVDIDLSLWGGGPNRDYYGASAHSKSALVGTVRVAF